MTDTLPFSNIPPTPDGHFKLYFYAAVLYVLDHVTRLFDEPAAALKEFPFLLGYQQQLAGCGLEGKSISDAAQWWQAALRDWESAVDDHLPLRALREATSLDHAALTQLLTVGLIEEDPRFGLMFDALQGTHGYQRPTIGLLSAWQDEERDTRTNLRHLQQLGLIHIINPEVPRLDQTLQVPALIWDALRGERPEVVAAWARYRAPDRLLSRDELILPDDVHDTLQTLPALLASGEVQTVIVRGPRHNGRHTLLGALAHTLGRGLLEIDQARQLELDQWRLIGPLSTLLCTLPVLAFELAPGESTEVHSLVGCDSPIGVVLSRTGGLNGAPIDRAVTIALELPDPALRKRHWQRAAASHPIGDLDSVGQRYRLTSGNIYRAAQLAGAQAALADREAIELEDVQQARRWLFICRPLAIGHSWPSAKTHSAISSNWKRAAANANASPVRPPARHTSTPECACCSAGQAAPAKRGLRACWQRSYRWTSIDSIFPRWSTSISARPRRT